MNEIDREQICLPLLETAPGFESIPIEALRWMAGGCYTRTASRGQVLCEKGQTMAGFFVLVSGRVKLSMLSADGSERVLDIVLPGQTFAEAAAFLNQSCPLHAEALADSRLVFVDLDRVRQAILRWPEVATLMLAIVSRRTQRLISDLEACCLHSAAQRVVGLLLRDAESNPRRPDRGTLTLPAAKTVVASSLNLTAETFSRELHGLANRGLIQVQRREITIPSLRALRTLAGIDDAGIPRVPSSRPTLGAQISD
ncbi:MAG: Crp/Fnr family transcriptional regulator [Thiohalocapsa sp.]